MTYSEDEIFIQAGKTEKNYWLDLWRFRELLYILSWRDIKVRYKQTVLGLAWSILRPLLSMIVLTIIFGRIARLPSEGSAPYVIMVFAGLLPWQFFANALSDASNSLVDNSSLISKVYFPRLIIPTSSVISASIDSLVSVVILIGLMCWYHYVPGSQVFVLPALIGLVFMAALGAGLLLTALNVKYRDFRYLLPFIVQFGLYISPVGFSSNVVPQQYRLMFYLNPMAGIIDCFRWAILNEQRSFPGAGFIMSLCGVFVTSLIGVWYFRRTERKFADII